MQIGAGLAARAGNRSLGHKAAPKIIGFGGNRTRAYRRTQRHTGMTDILCLFAAIHSAFGCGIATLPLCCPSGQTSQQPPRPSAPRRRAPAVDASSSIADGTVDLRSPLLQSMKKAAPNVHVAINVATILALAAVLGSAVWGYLPTYIFYRVAAVSVIVMLAFYLGHRVVPGITCRFIDRIFGK